MKLKRRGFLASLIIGSGVMLPDCFERVDVKVCKPQVGDVIVFRMKKRLLHSDFDRYRETVSRTFPGCRAIVLEDETDMEILRIEP